MRRSHKYDCNKVVKSYSDGGPVKKAGKKMKKHPKKNPLADYGTGSSTKKKMKDLGLADGGRVKPDRRQMKPPQSGGKPKRIGEDMGAPGGPHTPVAKGTYNPKPKRVR